MRLGKGGGVVSYWSKFLYSRYFQLHQVRIPSEVSQRKLDNIIILENAEEVREALCVVWLCVQPASLFPPRRSSTS